MELLEEDIEARYTRFKGAEWFGQNKKILIGGLGGTGSWLLPLLARTGNHEFYIFDDDTFEDHNMAGQFVTNKQIGLSKVDAAIENLGSFAGSKIDLYPFAEKYTLKSPGNPICFACFDNMMARMDMFTKWKKLLEKSEEEKRCEFLFVDLRLIAESFTIFFVKGNNPDQIAAYEKDLYSEVEILPVECSFKQTSHSAAMIASHTVALFTNWVSNVKEGADYRVLPFRTDYMTALNLYTNEYIQ